MRAVTIETHGDLFVPIVAATAKQLCVPTGRGCHLLPDLCMAGETGFLFGLAGVTQRNQRLMRIGVTTLAVIQLKMWPVAVAMVTGRDCFSACRRMLRMAVEAINLGGVFASGGGNSLLLEDMTLATVFQAQQARLGREDRTCEADRQQENCRAEAKANKVT